MILLAGGRDGEKERKWHRLSISYFRQGSTRKSTRNAAIPRPGSEAIGPLEMNEEQISRTHHSVAPGDKTDEYVL
jgi:hypothetical protein